MTDRLKIGFTALNRIGGVLVAFSNDGLKAGPATQKALAPIGDLQRRAAAADRFTGKIASTLTIIAPTGLDTPRLVVIGAGKERDLRDRDLVRLGGVVVGGVPATAGEVTVLAEFAGGALKAEQIAQLALGARLRAYRFDRYKTKRKEGDEHAEKVELNFACANPTAAERAWRRVEGTADGVVMARDLVNEPANVLYPVEFARRASGLRKLGVAVEVLDVSAMRKLGMGALLGVGQGSGHECQACRHALERRQTRHQSDRVYRQGRLFRHRRHFDQAGGRHGGHERRHGRRRMRCRPHACACRSQGASNAVGAIGLVENMPDGRAQRPGDIVTSMSGQTIEVINTDAEGRLVLADVLHYVNNRFKPKFMINLATLTGAIMVALGQEYAGLFSNDDKLVERLEKAGEATRERVWRMPLGPEYDKIIDSKFADMKNSAGRWAGSITAAQFLQRFVGKTPWAHLDIAGTALSSPQTDINKSWSSGWGVRLLDHLVADNYER